MHPAKSVIFFTTASGAGYGLLVALFAFVFWGNADVESGFVFGAFTTAFLLIASGLLSSTFHLGHPERAWRALSQWRTSWLSREGVAALVTFIPMGIFFYTWTTFGIGHSYTQIFGALTALLSLITVYCTAMIYASLKAIPAWQNRWTAPVYLMFAIMTGVVLFNFLAEFYGISISRAPLYATVGFLAVGFLFKVFYWMSLNRAGGETTIQEATGLTATAIRQLDPPHDGANYLLTEMGFQIARKHSEKLRTLSILSGFAVPTLILMLTEASFPGGEVYSAGLALLYVGIGVVMERWLFFAEAKHVVTLYYGEEKV